MPNRKAVITKEVILDLAASDRMTDVAIRTEADDEFDQIQYVKGAMSALGKEMREHLLAGKDAFGKDDISAEALYEEAVGLDEPLTDREFGQLQTLAESSRPDLMQAVSSLKWRRVLSASVEDVRIRQQQYRDFRAAIRYPRIPRGAFSKAYSR